MISSIYARVFAIPVSFPEKLRLSFEILDERSGELLAHLNLAFLSPWPDVQTEFVLDEAFAKRCEDQLANGVTTLIAEPRKCTGEWDEGPEAYHVAVEL
jgi:hypothetical protein